MISIENIKENKELIKHTSAIHCSNTLSLLQRKISNVLLFHAYPQLMDREEHKISIKELCGYLEYKGNNYEVIKIALKALISTVVEWNITDDKTGNEDWTASSILASVNIKNSVCTYAYSPRMKDLLFSPSMYGKINLIVQAQFTSSYGLALYENCIRYKGLQKTKNFDISDFRKIMGVSGNKYLVFRDFKRRVLDKAVDEVNTLSNLFVKPEIKKIGRKVVSIIFTLKEKPKKKKLGNCKSNDIGEKGKNKEANLLVEKLQKEFGLTPNQINKLFKRYDEKYVFEKIGLIKNSNYYKQGKINNLAAYLLSALKDNYESAKSSVYKSNDLQIEKKEVIQKKEQQEEQYRRYQDKKIIKSYNKLQGKQKQQVNREFSDHIKNNVYHLLFLKEGIQNILVADQFCNFIRSKKISFLKEIQSFDEYCKR